MLNIDVVTDRTIAPRALRRRYDDMLRRCNEYVQPGNNSAGQ